MFIIYLTIVFSSLLPSYAQDGRLEAALNLLGAGGSAATGTESLNINSETGSATGSNFSPTGGSTPSIDHDVVEATGPGPAFVPLPPPLPLPFTNANTPRSTTLACASTSCLSCTSKTGCGWMTNEGTCLNGTSEGPGTGLNISEFQLENFWQYGSCLDAACEDYSSCHQCMADHLCGWCSSTEKCTTDYGAKHQKEQSKPNDFCPAGWCAHPQGLHPVLHRNPSHPKATDVRDQCLKCQNDMQTNQDNNPEEEQPKETNLETKSSIQNETLQVEALERVVGGVEDTVSTNVTLSLKQESTESDVKLVVEHSNTLITDWKIAEKTANQACALLRSLQQALEEESNTELNAEENGGGEDLIASALGETSAHDALAQRVGNAANECTTMKKKSIDLQNNYELKNQNKIISNTTNNGNAAEDDDEVMQFQNLTLQQKITIQEQKSQAANIATLRSNAEQELKMTQQNLKKCQNDEKKEEEKKECKKEKDHFNEKQAELNEIIAEQKQHEMMAKQSELDFMGGTALQKKFIAEDVDIQNKKIHLATIEKKIALGEMDEKEKLKAKADLLESEQQKSVDVLEEEVKEEKDSVVLTRLTHEMDEAKDLLEEDKDTAASLSGKTIQRNNANQIASQIMNEENGILNTPNGLFLAKKVEDCMRHLKNAVASKIPNPKNIITLSQRCQPSVKQLQNLTKHSMSPFEISKKYQQHVTYEESALLCLEEGRTMEDCSIRVRGNSSTGGVTLPSLSALNTKDNTTAMNDTSDSSVIDASECCTREHAKCLACRARQSMTEYCHINDAVDAPIEGCTNADQSIPMNLTFTKPNLEKIEKKAFQDAKLFLNEKGNEEEEQEEQKTQETPFELAARTLNIVVSIGGMSCNDVVTPSTEQSISRSLSIVLQTDLDTLQTSVLCDDDVKGQEELPIEEKALELQVKLMCVTSASKMLKKQMIQSLNGNGLSTVTETIVNELIKHNACPQQQQQPENLNEKKMTKKEMIQGACANIVVESLTPQISNGNSQFITVFGYTMSDLMRIVGTKPPQRKLGPPGEQQDGQDMTWLASENQRLSFVRSFLEEYNLNVLLKDTEDWNNKVTAGIDEKLKETQKKYDEALKIYKLSKNYHNPIMNAIQNKIDGNPTNHTFSKFETEMLRISKNEKLKEKMTEKELKKLTLIFSAMEPVIQNNTEATGEPSTFAWPTEHEIVENWLGIKVVTNSTNQTKSLKDMVQFQENEAAKKARAAFLSQRKKIWEQRMLALKKHALEENKKNQENQLLHDRRIRIATENIEEQNQKLKIQQQRKLDYKNIQLNIKYTMIENQTDSMDAQDYMKVLKETAKLKAREMALQARDTAFENGVSKLKQVENHQLNMTHDEKEELAEEVQDDMMKLDVERARAAAEATQAEMEQTAKEFEQVKSMQTKQKVEDEDTMEKAAEAIEENQIASDSKHNMTAISVEMIFCGITVEKWDKSKSDNLFLLKTFIVKWIGIDPNKLQIQLLTSPASHTAKQCSVPTAVQEATIATDVDSEVQEVSLLESNQQQKKITRKRLRSQKIQKPSVSLISSITFQITMEVPTDRTEDIVSVKTALSKLEKIDTGSEINIAAKEMTKELDCSSLQTVIRTKDSYVQEEGSTPPSKRTNATEVEELASHGDLNALTNTINATDTPDIASAVEAQKLEKIATADTMPIKILPDQAMTGQDSVFDAVARR